MVVALLWCVGKFEVGKPGCSCYQGGLCGVVVSPLEIWMILIGRLQDDVFSVTLPIPRLLSFSFSKDFFERRQKMNDGECVTSSNATSPSGSLDSLDQTPSEAPATPSRHKKKPSHRIFFILGITPKDPKIVCFCQSRNTADRGHMMMPHTGWGTPPPAHFCFFSASFSSWLLGDVCSDRWHEASFTKTMPLSSNKN